MIRIFAPAFPLVALAAAITASPAFGVSGGNLDVLQRGEYICEWPSDEGGENWRKRAPELDFLVISGSRYETDDGVGIYLRTGKHVQFTSGPRKGENFEMKSDRFLRRLGQEGERDGLRCVRKRLSEKTD